MSGQHTPGPWEAEHGADSFFYVTHDDGMELRNFREDACLIAAAPDLLEEMEQQADGCATIAGLLRGQDSPAAAALLAMLQFQEANARFAIAKARGAA